MPNRKGIPFLRLNKQKMLCIFYLRLKIRECPTVLPARRYFLFPALQSICALRAETTGTALITAKLPESA